MDEHCDASSRHRDPKTRHRLSASDLDDAHEFALNEEPMHDCEGDDDNQDDSELLLADDDDGDFNELVDVEAFNLPCEEFAAPRNDVDAVLRGRRREGKRILHRYRSKQVGGPLEGRDQEEEARDDQVRRGQVAALPREERQRVAAADSNDVKELKKGNKTPAIEALTLDNEALEGESGLPKLLKDMSPPTFDEIHVLVVVPATPVSGFGASMTFGAYRDSTSEWLDEFLARRIPYHALPAMESLKTFVEQPLPVKIRMPSELLTAWSKEPIYLGQQLEERMFTIDNSSPCIAFRSLVLSERFLTPLRTGNSENSYIWFWDTVVRAVLDFIFSRASVDRDSSKGSSTGKKRPDFVFTLNDVCVFRGEEKASYVSIQLPRSELRTKLAWIYGDVPYVFGYATSGYKVDLLALYDASKDAGDLSDVEIDVPDVEMDVPDVGSGDASNVENSVGSYRIGSFDLEQTAQRFRFVLALLNLCRLFPAITENCPDSGHNEFSSIHRGNGVVVRLNPTFVEKIFPNLSGFDQLDRIYCIMRRAKAPNVDRLLKLKRTKMSAIFAPRGTMVKPRNLFELFVALRHVLEALVVLHSNSVMHRDIRWSNVIKRRDRDAWFLIDFADAAISPQRFPDGSHLSTREHAPEIFEAGGSHTTAVDIWSVGYLIESRNVGWDDLGRRTAFLKRLLEVNQATRPTAETALQELLELEGAMQDVVKNDTLRLTHPHEGKRGIQSTALDSNPKKSKKL